jgi:hypothetical protein
MIARSSVGTITVSVDDSGAGHLPDLETVALPLQEKSEGLGDLLRLLFEYHCSIL